MSVSSLRRTVLAPLFGALVGSAWLALVVWSRSPYGRFVHHGSTPGTLDERMLSVAMVGMWTLMIVAMMLPTSLPLFILFHRMTRHRRDRVALVLLVGGGYLTVWTLFGMAAVSGDRLLHALVDQAAWVRDHAWTIGAGTIGVAGLYQFSRWKRACLDVCRTPQSFLVSHWLRRRDPAQAFRLGARHGIVCVGCCWSLMLLMFVVGTGSIGWMLALGAVMAIEKNVAWGKRLSAPVGVALLCWGIVIGLRGLLAA